MSSENDPQPEPPVAESVELETYEPPLIERVNDGTTQLAACTMAISC
jgi:hypothetical protein